MFCFNNIFYVLCARINCILFLIKIQIKNRKKRVKKYNFSILKYYFCVNILYGNFFSNTHDCNLVFSSRFCTGSKHIHAAAGQRIYILFSCWLPYDESETKGSRRGATPIKIIMEILCALTKCMQLLLLSNFSALNK